MINEQNVNQPIKVLLLGSDTVVGNELLLFSKDLHEFQWQVITCAELLTRNETDLFSGIHPCDVVIDALSIDRSLDARYPRFRKELSRYSSENDCQIVMISSALVFSGDKDTAYEEHDAPDCQDAYSRALITTEALFLELPKTIVLRTGWLFSGTNDDFVCRTIDLIKQGVNLAYNDNFVGSPSPVSDLARVTLTMIKQDYYGAKNTGIYHYCCSEEISWFGFVEAILATAGQFDGRAQINVEAINECFPDAADVAYIKRQSLSCRKIFNHFGVKQRPWRASLRKLVKNLYQRV